MYINASKHARAAVGANTLTHESRLYMKQALPAWGISIGIREEFNFEYTTSPVFRVWEISPAVGSSGKPCAPSMDFLAGRTRNNWGG